MTISEQLDALRGDFSDCMSVAFADISTGMILSASSQQHFHQEHLDALCATATDMLTGETSKRISSVWQSPGEAAIQQAVIFDTSQVGIFLTSPQSPGDALCCACAPSIDIGAFLQQASVQFAKLQDQLIAP